MLAAVRRFAKSPWAAALLVLLIISFAVFGIRDVFNAQTSAWVIKAGSRQMNSADFKRDFDGYKKQAEQQAQKPITMEEVAAQGLDRQVLNELAMRESMSEWLNRIGVRPADALVAAQLHKSTALFDPVTGKFDNAVYQQRLAENGFTPATYEATLRDEIAADHFMSAAFAGFRAPRVYTALAGAYALEARDISYVVVTPQMVGPVPPPTDAELTAFMNENRAQIMRPEFRVLSVVKFAPKADEAGLKVDPAKVLERFNFRKDSLSTPETRSVVQIPVTAQQAAGVADRLRKGEDPAAVAKSVGKQPLVLTDKPKSALPDRKVADVAFTLKAGEVSGAIAGDLGTSVVKVVKVTPAVVATLEEHRAAIETELRNELALAKVDEQSQAYEEAHAAGANLLEAAAKAGALSFTIGPVTAQGQALAGAATTGLTQKIVETGFSLPAGGESDLTDAGGGEYFAVRVERIIPPSLPPLAEVRAQLLQVYVGRKQLERMTQRANALVERAKKGESLSSIAASIGGKVGTLAGLNRLQASQNQSLGQDLPGKVFSAKTGDVFVAQMPQFALAVGKLDAVKPGDPRMIAQAIAGQEAQTSNLLYRTLTDTARKATAAKLKTKTNLALAKTAIGLDAGADTTPAATGEGAIPGLAK
jgi:peptidyl-prolyl cis-trans isomerase D